MSKSACLPINWTILKLFVKVRAEEALMIEDEGIAVLSYFGLSPRDLSRPIVFFICNINYMRYNNIHLLPSLEGDTNSCPTQKIHVARERQIFVSPD